MIQHPNSDQMRLKTHGVQLYGLCKIHVSLQYIYRITIHTEQNIYISISIRVYIYNMYVYIEYLVAR